MINIIGEEVADLFIHSSIFYSSNYFLHVQQCTPVFLAAWENEGRGPQGKG